MAKKIYTKPFFVVEEFVPQEYIANCEFNNVSNISGWSNTYGIHYIDLDNNGIYSTGERFNNNGNAVPTASFSSKSKGSVKSYKLELYSNKWEESNVGLPAGASYSSYTSSGNVKYRGIVIATAYFRITDGIAYYSTTRS